MADGIVLSMLRHPRLDDRRRDIVERALKAARREEFLSRREVGDRSALVVFDRDRGELRITVSMERHDDGQEAETLALTIRELGQAVFEVEARALRVGHDRVRTVVTVRRDVQSYWEMILRHIA